MNLSSSVSPVLKWISEQSGDVRSYQFLSCFLSGREKLPLFSAGSEVFWETSLISCLCSFSGRTPSPRLP